MPTRANTRCTCHWSRTFLVVLGLGGWLAPGGVRADIDDDISRALQLTCRYADYGSLQLTSVSLAPAAGDGGDVPGTWTFQRGDQGSDKTFLVRNGQAAECVFPGGARVRAKVGAGSVRPFGPCGADPNVFVSLWVNQRKVASKTDFAGRCRDDTEQPRVSFDLKALPDWSIRKCHTRRGQPAGGESSGSPTPASEGDLTVCVDYPEVSRFPIDEVEYPPAGAATRRAGDLDVLTDEHEVCAPARMAMISGGLPVTPRPGALAVPAWGPPTTDLPAELEGSEESVFDFDNDGAPDRVFRRELMTGYLFGTVLLVQPGHASSQRPARGPTSEARARLLPCQWDPNRHPLRDCPLFSQLADEAGFAVKDSRNGQTVWFRSRYTLLHPFFYKGSTFVEAISTSEIGSKNHLAVLKPHAEGFETSCLFRRIEENF